MTLREDLAARVLLAIFILLDQLPRHMARIFTRGTSMIGGGVGFPVGQSSDFANSGKYFVVGGGRNFVTGLGVNSEFMWHDLPPKRSLLDAFRHRTDLLGVCTDPKRNCSIWTMPRFGAYVIGGGGWYHRSGELTNPVLVPGTTCTPPIYWWSVGCVDGLVPSHEVIASRSSDAFGGNIGGGVTIPLSENGFSFYKQRAITMTLAAMSTRRWFPSHSVFAGRLH